MNIPRHVIDEIIEKTDIVALVSPYVKLTKKGKNYMGLCPFHEDKSPSFSVSTEKHLAKCMACGEGGNPITFYQKIKNVSFNQAAKALADQLNIKLDIEVEESKTLKEHDALKSTNAFYQFYLFNSESGKQALNYLYGREMSDEQIKHFEIGLAPKEKGDSLYRLLKSQGFEEEVMLSAGLIKQRDDGTYYDLMTNRVTFPIHDDLDRVVGFSGRTLDKNDQIKYLNTPETVVFKKGEVLYHLSKAIRDIRLSKHVILHEGFFDVIASYKSDLKNAVATMGTALTRQQAKLIKRMSNRIIVAYDGDKAGINATLKAIPLLLQEGLMVEVLSIPDGLDPDDFYKEYGKEKYEELYGQFLEDPFQFGYRIHKRGLDLTNSNDIQVFQKNVSDLLIYADKTVKEIYLKKLSSDIGVSVESLTIKKQAFQPKAQETNLDLTKKNQLPYKAKPYHSSLPRKFYKAEKQLLIVMMKNKEYAPRIEQALGTTKVVNIDMLKLRTILYMDYYQTNDVFEVEAFKHYLKDDHLIQVFEHEIIQSLEWRTTFVFKESDIEDLLNTMSLLMDIKEYKKIIDELKSVEESYTQTLLAERQKKLKNGIESRKKVNR